MLLVFVNHRHSPVLNLSGPTCSSRAASPERTARHSQYLSFAHAAWFSSELLLSLAVCRHSPSSIILATLFKLPGSSTAGARRAARFSSESTLAHPLAACRRSSLSISNLLQVIRLSSSARRACRLGFKLVRSCSPCLSTLTAINHTRNILQTIRLTSTRCQTNTKAVNTAQVQSLRILQTMDGKDILRLLYATLLQVTLAALT